MRHLINDGVFPVVDKQHGDIGKNIYTISVPHDVKYLTL